MAANDNPQLNDDARSEAVQHAEAGAQAWRAAVQALRSAQPEHGEFYALAGELAEVLHALTDLATHLANQVSTYGDGRVLRDDEPDQDPAERLTAAWLLAAQLGDELGGAQLTTGRFWSTVGHIGVEDVTS